MAAIRRSNTAPQPLQCQIRPPFARAKSTIDARSDQSLSSCQYRLRASLTAGPTFTTAREREDPFNLAGFFPARYLLSPERGEGEDWEWLRQEQQLQLLEPERDELHSVFLLPEHDGSLPATPSGVVFAEAGEDVIEDTINGEDKMGVLSVLNSIFLTKDSQLSSEDEAAAADHESLYLALSQLRHAECSRPTSSQELELGFLEQEVPATESGIWSMQWWSTMLNFII